MQQIKESFQNNIIARYLLECNNFMDVDSYDFFTEYIADNEYYSDFSMIID
jgi:hypothetical protein